MSIIYTHQIIFSHHLSVRQMNSFGTMRKYIQQFSLTQRYINNYNLRFEGPV